VSEANLLVKEFNRDIKFSVKIINNLPDDVEADEDLDPNTWEKITMVEVINHDYGLI